MQWTRVFAYDKIVKSIVNFISALLILCKKSGPYHDDDDDDGTQWVKFAKINWKNNYNCSAAWVGYYSNKVMSTEYV